MFCGEARSQHLDLPRMQRWRLQLCLTVEMALRGETQPQRQRVLLSGSMRVCRGEAWLQAAQYAAANLRYLP